MFPARTLSDPATGVSAWRLHGAKLLAFAFAFACVAVGAVQAAAAPVRGDILDRRGVVLATTVESPSLYANPRHVVDPSATAEAIAARFGRLDVDALRSALSRDTSFVWIARHAESDQVGAVMALGLNGIGVKLEHARRYPEGRLAAHVVGFTDGEASVGLGGIEMSRDAVLKRGQSERLSIDTRVQAAVRDELTRAMADYSVHAVGGIVLDAASGEILALVSLPDYDPADRASIAPHGYKNIVTSNVYEMGGLFEIFTTAAALEAHRVNPDTRLTVTPTLWIGAHRVRDENPVRMPLSVEDIFARSSLIGAALIAERSTPAEQQADLRRMGLLEPMGVELVESGSAPLISYRAWGPNLRTAIGYGYGIALTPLQAASVATAVVNHGLLMEPTLLARTGNLPQSRTIVSEATSMRMRELLRAAVVRGTGHSADVPGYAVGGKTGTSLKQTAYHYDRTRRTWFFAGFPMTEAPRYTVLVMLDDPQDRPGLRGSTTAEWNAVPVAGRIIERIGPLLGVAPLSMAQTLPELPR
jgi:cell division protein FtsI (penicillin-binding protein 3)